MNRSNTAAATKNNQKNNNTVKKDAICLGLVITAVFILHVFSKNTVDQLYKAKEKNNVTTTISAPLSAKKASFF